MLHLVETNVLALAPTRPIGRLLLVRHGESTWNVENRFTGWADVPLTAQGAQSAIDAAALLHHECLAKLAPTRRLARTAPNTIDAVYTSKLQRCVLFAHSMMETLEARGHPPMAYHERWRLNERHYGELTGFNKRQALEAIDAPLLAEWRSTYDGKPPEILPADKHYTRRKWGDRAPARPRPPGAWRVSSADDPLPSEHVPLTESIGDARRRSARLWEGELLPELMAGKTLLLVGHANAMRALISCIQPLSDEQLSSLGVPNAIPLVYSFDEHGVARRFECDEGVGSYVPPLQAFYLGSDAQGFSKLDADGSGSVDASELANSSLCLTDEECAFLLSEADNNGDGMLDFKEYVSWARSAPGAERLRYYKQLREDSEGV